MNIAKQLTTFLKNHSHEPSFHLPQVELTPENIRAVMVNEVVPPQEADNFYSGEASEYAQSALHLFQKAGANFKTMRDVLQNGIYVTNAVKIPKTESAIPKATIELCAPLLEHELSLFPNLQVIMLMGDVAIKAFNIIAKKKTGKNALPAISTYKLRRNTLHFEGTRVMPSYIMTGGNIRIEKSKVTMITEDIQTMLHILHG